MDNTFIHAFFWFFTNDVIVLHSLVLILSVFSLTSLLYIIKNWGF